MEAVRDRFIEVIKKSWTWERLTEEERDACLSHLLEVVLVGSEYQARNNLRVVYHAFLDGAGYWRDGIKWREPEEDVPSF